jgi:hypothetical protein
MNLPKAVYDPAKKSKNLVTTITGIVTLIISVLVGFNILTPDQSTQLQAHATTLVNSGVAIFGVVNALILMFKAKD